MNAPTTDLPRAPDARDAVAARVLAFPRPGAAPVAGDELAAVHLAAHHAASPAPALCIGFGDTPRRLAALGVDAHVLVPPLGLGPVRAARRWLRANAAGHGAVALYGPTAATLAPTLTRRVRAIRTHAVPLAAPADLAETTPPDRARLRAELAIEPDRLCVACLTDSPDAVDARRLMVLIGVLDLMHGRITALIPARARRLRAAKAFVRGAALALDLCVYDGPALAALAAADFALAEPALGTPPPGPALDALLAFAARAGTPVHGEASRGHVTIPAAARHPFLPHTIEPSVLRHLDAQAVREQGVDDARAAVAASASA